MHNERGLELRLHSLRRIFDSVAFSGYESDERPNDTASWWAQAGATALQIKELLGHTYVKTTERYTRIPPTELRHVVDSLAPF